MPDKYRIHEWTANQNPTPGERVTLHDTPLPDQQDMKYFAVREIGSRPDGTELGVVLTGTPHTSRQAAEGELAAVAYNQNPVDRSNATVPPEPDSSFEDLQAPAGFREQGQHEYAPPMPEDIPLASDPALDHLVEQWAQENVGRTDTAPIFTESEQTAARINQRCHDTRVAQQPDGPTMICGDTPLQVKDTITFSEAFPAAGIEKGDRGIVQSIDQKNNSFNFRGESGLTTVSLADEPQVELSYAQTIDKMRDTAHTRDSIIVYEGRFADLENASMAYEKQLNANGIKSARVFDINSMTMSTIPSPDSPSVNHDTKDPKNEPKL